MYLFNNSNTFVALMSEYLEDNIISVGLATVHNGEEVDFHLSEAVNDGEWVRKKIGCWTLLDKEGKPAKNISGFTTNLILLKR